MLSPAVGSQTAFDIPGKMLEDGYFHDLYSHVEMLNIVLCDIYDYVREEAKALRSDASGASGLSTPDSPRKGSSDKSKSELETIRTLLEKLHGKIGMFGLYSVSCTSAHLAIQWTLVRQI